MLRSMLGDGRRDALGADARWLPGGRRTPSRADPLDGLTVHPEWGSITGTSGVLSAGLPQLHASPTRSRRPRASGRSRSSSADPRGSTTSPPVRFLDGYDPKTRHAARYTLLPAYDHAVTATLHDRGAR